jgi:hypothetical protein
VWYGQGHVDTTSPIDYYLGFSLRIWSAEMLSHTQFGGLEEKSQDFFADPENTNTVI